MDLRTLEIEAMRFPKRHLVRAVRALLYAGEYRLQGRLDDARRCLAEARRHVEFHEAGL